MHEPRLALACVALVMLSANPARASHYSVDAAGGADFTTITAAIHQHTLSARDSILVAPGSYADTLAFSVATPSVTVLGTGGAGATSAASIAITTGKTTGPPLWRIEGLTFTGDVAPRFDADIYRCAFLQGVSIGGGSTYYGGTNFHDCDFYGPTHLGGSGPYPYRSVFERLHFHAAPLSIGAGATATTITDCTFEGPADLLVNAYGTYDETLIFLRCSFANATNGVIAPSGCRFDRCTARDITGSAIGYEEKSRPSPAQRTELSVSNSRFDRCGSAIRWILLGYDLAYLTADTVYASTGNAIEVTENAPPPSISSYYNPDLMNGLIVDGAAGDGIVMRSGNDVGGVGMAHCRVSNVAGDGVHFLNTGSGDGSRIWDCRSDHNGGDGFRIDKHNCTFRNNIAWANGGDGFEFTPSDYRPDTVVSNTSVGNGGAGFRLVARTHFPYRVAALVRSNLAVGNKGIGFIAPQHGSFAFNDVWDNAGGTYEAVASPADSNLTIDPLLCNLAAGDLGLQDGSPCAPSGPYGLIGARPVGCTAFAAVPPQAPTMAFTMHPNPARGSVEFAAPAGGGRVEVVDPQGRRVWGGALRAGETLRWDGSGVAGRVPPGIYLVRFRGAAGARTVRLAWIE